MKKEKRKIIIPEGHYWVRNMLQQHFIAEKSRPHRGIYLGSLVWSNGISSQSLLKKKEEKQQ